MRTLFSSEFSSASFASREDLLDVWALIVRLRNMAWRDSRERVINRFIK